MIAFAYNINSHEATTKRELQQLHLNSPCALAIFSSIHLYLSLEFIIR